MSWGTGKTGGGGDGEHAAGKDPGTARACPEPSPDAAQPKPGPKHGE
ncbi:hypothetical protein [Streptomyces scopuliridis]